MSGRVLMSAESICFNLLLRFFYWRHSFWRPSCHAAAAQQPPFNVLQKAFPIFFLRFFLPIYGPYGGQNRD